MLVDRNSAGNRKMEGFISRSILAFANAGTIQSISQEGIRRLTGILSNKCSGMDVEFGNSV